MTDEELLWEQRKLIEAGRREATAATLLAALIGIQPHSSGSAKWSELAEIAVVATDALRAALDGGK